MFKTGLTQSLFKEFSSNYQSISKSSNNQNPYFFADADGIKIVTNVVGLMSKKDQEICAMTMAEDGWIEIVSLI